MFCLGKIGPRRALKILNSVPRGSVLRYAVLSGFCAHKFVCFQVKGKSNLLDLSTVTNGDLLAGLAIPEPKVLHGFHNIHASLHPVKDNELAIQPFSLGSADEKQGTVCVGASLCHGQDARTHMLQDETLIIKILPIDGLAISAFMAYEVTTLAHKSQNYSVKAGLACNKSSTNTFCEKKQTNISFAVSSIINTRLLFSNYLFKQNS